MCGGRGARELEQREARVRVRESRGSKEQGKAAGGASLCSAGARQRGMAPVARCGGDGRSARRQ